MAVVEKKKYTEADYQLLEEGAPYQLINGDLVMSPSPTSYHQLLSARLFKAIDAFLEKNNDQGVFLYAPIDVVLDNENVFQPNLIYISEERKKELFHDRIMAHQISSSKSFPLPPLHLI